jgi:hypothetical protein
MISVRTCTHFIGKHIAEPPALILALADLDSLLGITVVNLPQVVGKWLTYVLVLHIVGACYL